MKAQNNNLKYEMVQDKSDTALHPSKKKKQIMGKKQIRRLFRIRAWNRTMNEIQNKGKIEHAQDDELTFADFMIWSWLDHLLNHDFSWLFLLIFPLDITTRFQ